MGGEKCPWGEGGGEMSGEGGEISGEGGGGRREMSRGRRNFRGGREMSGRVGRNVRGGGEMLPFCRYILYTVIFPLPFLSPTTLYIWFLNKLCFQEFCDISGRDKIAYLAKLNVENVPVAKLQECKNFPFAGS